MFQDLFFVYLCLRIEMLYEGTRDFLRAYIRMCFDPEETVKTEVKEKALPRYLPAFEKVSVVEKYSYELD